MLNYFKSILLIFSTVSFLIIHFFRTNTHEVFIYDIYNPLIVILIISFFLLFLINKFVKNIYSSSVIIILYLILFFLYHHILEFILYKKIFGFIYGKSEILFPVYIGLFVLIFFLYKIYTNRTFNFFIIFIAVLLIYEICVLILTYNSYNNIIIKNNRVPFSVENINNINKPNIYYIIFDEYGRNDSLLENYGFDNSIFINELKNKGFYIVSKAISNYPGTRLSIPATFDMNYIVKNEEYINLKTYKPLIYKFQQNRISEILKKSGYYYIHIKSGTKVTEKNIYADKIYDFNYLSSFSFLLLDLTPLRIKKIKNYIIGELKRSNILRTFKQIEMISSEKHVKPLFLFAHILSPHEPYLFDRYGNKIYQDYNHKIGIQSKNYSEQVLFLNKKIENMVDSIIKNTNDNAIIIIQADHGLAPIYIKRKERYEIFSSFYFPDKDYSLLYDELSLINTWRVIIKKYFNDDIELLEDKLFWSDILQPYNIKEINDL